MDQFESLLSDPYSVEDPMLAAVAQTCIDDEVLSEAWGVRLATLTIL